MLWQVLCGWLKMQIYTNQNGTNTQIQKYINTQIRMTTDPGQEVLWMKAPSLALLFLSLLVPARKSNIWWWYQDDTMLITIATFLLPLLISTRFHHQRSFSLQFLHFGLIFVIFWMIYQAFMLPHLLRLLLMRLRFLSPRVCCCWPPPPLFGRIFKICDVLSDCRW